MKFGKIIFKHWFLVSAIILLSLAAYLRFYDYGQRWGLAYDQAYSAVLARYALEAFKLPLVGPFSSAGAFQTGGEWYWFVMLGTLINPSWIISPWLFLTFTYVVFVYLLIILGKELINKEFGLLVGALSVVSTAEIAQSVNLTNQSPLAIISLFSIWSMVRYIKTKKLKYLFLLGFAVSLAISFHLQGAALLIFVLITIIFGRIFNFKGLLAILAGFFIPMLPILLFDLQNNFTNLRNVIQYYFHDQYKISLDVLGRRWLTYAGVFWPNSWANIIGGNKIISFITFAALAWVLIDNFIKKTISKEWQIIIVSFIGIVTLIRYTRTPLFDSYLVFLHPFVFLLVGFSIFSLYKKNIFIGLGILLIVLAGSLHRDFLEFKTVQNYSAVEVNRTINDLFKKFPNKKFSIYTYKYKDADKNLILVLYLMTKNKISNNGRRIGIIVQNNSEHFDYAVINGVKGNYQLLDLQSSSPEQLPKLNWGRLNPEDVYQSTEQWYHKK